jgi:uncharacterized membrane-anchored protein
MLSRLTAKALAIALVLFALPVIAQEQKRDYHPKDGPTQVRLNEQATLSIPSGYVFLDSVDSKALLRDWGNFPGDNTLGMVLPKAESENWALVFDYNGVGYVRDDDAKDWNADDIMESMRATNAENNERRRAAGIPEFTLRGWLEKPHYDAGAHKVTWSTILDDNHGQTANFKTLTLGRHGYVGMTMVTGAADLANDRTHVHAILTGLSFVDGSRYSDFNVGTDTVAAVGLTALIAGAAAKAGFFGKIGAVLLPLIFALKKFAIYIAIAAGAGLWGLIKRLRS